MAIRTEERDGGMERLLTSSSDNVLLQSLLLTSSSILTLSCWNVFTGLKADTEERVRAVRQSDVVKVRYNSILRLGVSL